MMGRYRDPSAGYDDYLDEMEAEQNRDRIHEQIDDHIDSEIDKMRDLADERKRQEEAELIYISGPISGRAYIEASLDFLIAEEVIRKAGNIPINPLHLAISGLTYEQQTKMDLAVLALCDAIYMLTGWEQSSGASTERRVAEISGIRIIYQEKMDDKVTIDLEKLITGGENGK